MSLSILKSPFLTSKLTSTFIELFYQFIKSASFKKQANFSLIPVTAFKKFADDLSTSSKYSFEMAAAKRTAQGQFVLDMKEDETKGNFDVAFKKEAAVQFGWKNEFSVKSKTGESVNDGKNSVTQHEIKL